MIANYSMRAPKDPLIVEDFAPDLKREWAKSKQRPKLTDEMREEIAGGVRRLFDEGSD